MTLGVHLRGAESTGVWVDTPGHRVTLGLRLDRTDGPTDYLLVLEAVTGFSYCDESGDPGADARGLGGSLSACRPGTAWNRCT